MEQWLVSTFNAHYQVSNLGRVRNIRTGRILRPVATPKGYLSVALGKHNRKYVHRVVACAFLGEPPALDSQINHLDGDRANNRADNLEWCTPRENVNHARDVLGHRSGPKLGHKWPEERRRQHSDYMKRWHASHKSE